jgi:DNA-binding response OmpR family regulator
MRILIADDEPMSRRLLQITLERAGYEVIAVENGRQATDQICKLDGPRLALLEVMPELDGPGVCREVRLRKEQSYVYMVHLTSKEAKEDIVTGLESGAGRNCVKLVSTNAAGGLTESHVDEPVRQS